MVISSCVLVHQLEKKFHKWYFLYPQGIQKTPFTIFFLGSIFKVLDEKNLFFLDLLGSDLDSAIMPLIQKILLILVSVWIKLSVLKRPKKIRKIRSFLIFINQRVNFCAFAAVADEYKYWIQSLIKYYRSVTGAPIF